MKVNSFLYDISSFSSLSSAVSLSLVGTQQGKSFMHFDGLVLSLQFVKFVQSFKFVIGQRFTSLVIVKNKGNTITCNNSVSSKEEQQYSLICASKSN